MIKIIIMIDLAIFSSGVSSADSVCGEWASYRDEKCFKVVNTLIPFSGTAELCEKEGATIGIIGSVVEQKLIEAELENKGIVDNVWIGIKMNGKTFLSVDGKALIYTDWANGRPLKKSDMDCVVISMDNQNKWLDVKCEKKNAVLCEKVLKSQQSSNPEIEIVLTQMRKELVDLKLNLGKEIHQLKLIQTNLVKRINTNQNAVPIGFIYAQLSGQSEPHTLWPKTEWSDISDKYAGLFFRAQGGGSSSFGETQDEKVPSLQLQVRYCNLSPNSCLYDKYGYDYKKKNDPISVTTNFYWKDIITGTHLKIIQPKSTHGDVGINFKYTTDEIRPRNQAIRIWIRIK